MELRRIRGPAVDATPPAMVLPPLLPQWAHLRPDIQQTDYIPSAPEQGQKRRNRSDPRDFRR